MIFCFVGSKVNFRVKPSELLLAKLRGTSVVYAVLYPLWWTGVSYGFRRLLAADSGVDIVVSEY